MSCKDEVELQLSRYIDHELDAEERSRIEEHLRLCVPCRDLLRLFQRNESVLGNALSGEAFGAQMVDGVMAEIRRLEQPTIVAPLIDESGGSVKERLRRTWPAVAAAALMLLTAGMIISWPPRRAGSAELESVKAELERQYRQALLESHAVQQQTFKIMEDRLREMSQELRDVAARAELQSEPNHQGLAYYNRRAAILHFGFSKDKFSAFDVYRRRQGQESWDLLKQGLPTPSYEDSHVEPGVTYVYKCRAHYQGSEEFIESAPPVEFRLPLPRGVDPQFCLRIVFQRSTDPSQAVFRVERYVDQRWIGQEYTVTRGERLGRNETLLGEGVDLTTNYELESVSAGEEILVGKVGTEDRAIGMRPNLQARLRARVPVPEGEDVVSIWRDGEVFIPLPR
ncbi:MAG: zf-HC2 domain-containing protein [Planctomycetes bacterium]|nr:zf-HC2 domain-containing protein [Planctomycetota bacterium]